MNPVDDSFANHPPDAKATEPEDEASPMAYLPPAPYDPFGEYVLETPTQAQSPKHATPLAKTTEVALPKRAVAIPDPHDIFATEASSTRAPGSRYGIGKPFRTIVKGKVAAD